MIALFIICAIFIATTAHLLVQNIELKKKMKTIAAITESMKSVLDSYREEVHEKPAKSVSMQRIEILRQAITNALMIDYEDFTWEFVRNNLNHVVCTRTCAVDIIVNAYGKEEKRVVVVTDGIFSELLPLSNEEAEKIAEEKAAAILTTSVSEVTEEQAVPEPTVTEETEDIKEKVISFIKATNLFDRLEKGDVSLEKEGVLTDEAFLEELFDTLQIGGGCEIEDLGGSIVISR